VSNEPIKVLIKNRRASYDYFLEDRFEAGISLLGSEVKSLRGGRANLQEAYVRLTSKGAWLVGCHISPYEQANRENHAPLRERQLLLHRTELKKLHKAIAEKGKTVLPVQLYLKGSRVKVEIAIGKGKKNYDKRATLRILPLISQQNATQLHGRVSSRMGLHFAHRIQVDEYGQVITHIANHHHLKMAIAVRTNPSSRLRLLDGTKLDL